MITGELTDYKELVSNYHDKSEKEKFWIVIKKHFADEYEVKIVFKVFKLENQKKEILELIIKYPQTDCFPDMISFVQKDFPEQCFTNYKKKIEAILKETNVEKYKEVAYHLKRMKQIDNIQEFNIFLRWIKETYWRRRRLLEELRDV